jgi:hypothetical protein
MKNARLTSLARMGIGLNHMLFIAETTTGKKGHESAGVHGARAAKSGTKIAPAINRTLIIVPYNQKLTSCEFTSSQ